MTTAKSKVGRTPANRIGGLVFTRYSDVVPVPSRSVSEKPPQAAAPLSSSNLKPRGTATLTGGSDQVTIEREMGGTQIGPGPSAN